ncbi:NrdH-like glutaredoxin [Arthrobacter phage Atuin]|nr:NrdH-like glutaredoxin [Arthrobacter phage Atuin]
MNTTVYSKPSCVQCTATYRALKKDEIVHTSVDISEDAEAYDFVTKELGHSAAPVVVVRDGDEIVKHWSGFKRDHVSAIKTGEWPVEN